MGCGIFLAPVHQHSSIEQNSIEETVSVTVSSSSFPSREYYVYYSLQSRSSGASIQSANGRTNTSISPTEARDRSCLKQVGRKKPRRKRGSQRRGKRLRRSKFPEKDAQKKLGRSTQSESGRMSTLICRRTTCQKRTNMMLTRAGTRITNNMLTRLTPTLVSRLRWRLQKMYRTAVLRTAAGTSTQPGMFRQRNQPLKASR